MKSQFPGLSKSKQVANVDCHIESGVWFICWRKRKRKRDRQRRSDRQGGEESGQLELQLVFFFPLPHNEVGMESLRIRLINSYSSSAWHLGSRSGSALGLIFRPLEDSQSIKLLLRLCTTNFDAPPKSKERGTK